MIKNSILILTIIFLTGIEAYCQADKYADDSNVFRLSMQNKSSNLFRDSVNTQYNKKNPKKLNFGGLFLAPYIGISFPVGTFRDFSVSGLMYGVKAEIAFSKLYPFSFGFIYEFQKNSGDGDYITTNTLTYYDTQITYLGGSIDVILNKYIKTNFTMPVVSFEIKYATVTNYIGRENSTEEIPESKNIMTYSPGLAFTVYIFDLYSKYTFAGDYSNLTFLARIHFPFIKF